VVQEPQLYKRTVEEITRTIDEELAAYGWQGQPDGAGAAMVQLFGRLTDVIINRLNRAPEQHFRAFLNEAGIDRRPPRAARTELTFTPAADGSPAIQVEQGTQVATRPSENQPEIIFETERNLTVIASELATCIVVDRLNSSDRTALARGEEAGAFAAFQGDTERKRMLYIGHDTLFTFDDEASRENALVVLDFTFKQAGDPAADGDWRLEWLYHNGEQWERLEDAGAVVDDQTESFRHAGVVQFTNLPPLETREINGVQSVWLACQLTGGRDRLHLPEIKDIQIYQEIRIPPAETHTGDARVPVPSGRPFPGDEPAARIYYIGHDVLFACTDPISRQRARVTLQFSFDKPGEPPATEAGQVQWLYWDGEQWAALTEHGAMIEDQTEQWSRDGVVVFTRLPQLHATAVDDVSSFWLAAKVADATDPARLPVIRHVQIQREMPGEEAPIDAALAAVQAGTAFVPLELTGPFMPLGPLPIQLDTFYLRLDEAFTKPGATVTFAFTLEGLPTDLEDTTELDKLQIEWEYFSRDGWIRLGSCVRGCPAVEAYNFDVDERFTPTVTRIPISRRRVLEVAIPQGVDVKDLPPAFAAGQVSTDIYTGAQYIQFPLPAECADLPEEKILSSCYTAERLNFRDKTCAFTATGAAVVQFTVPEREGDDPPFAPTDVNGQAGYWIRARMAEGSYNVPRQSQRGVFAGLLFGEEPFLPPDTHAPVIERVRVTYSDYRRQTEQQRLSRCQSKTDAHWQNHASALQKGKSFTPFTARVEEPALHLGFYPLDPESAHPAFPAGKWTQIRFDIAEGAETGGKNAITWEYWQGDTWRTLPVVDGTFGLQRRGYVGFFAPADHRASCEFGHRGYWLRILPRADVSATTPGAEEPNRATGRNGNSEASFVMPRLKTIRLNTVPALNAETVRTEVLGSSSGEPNQRFWLTHSPVLPDLEIEVREPDQRAEKEAAEFATERPPGGRSVLLQSTRLQTETAMHEDWVRWYAVSTFHFQGPDSRAYMVDQHSGEIRFGDGQRGKIPPPGIENIRANRYRNHSGSSGNLSPRVITELRNPSGALNDIQSVTNIEAAAGGFDVEAVARAVIRGPQTLRNRQRAVSREDYQWLALEIEEVEYAYCLPTRNANGQQQPGWVTLVVMPKPSSAMPASAAKKPAPTPALLRDVRKYVETHALANLKRMGNAVQNREQSTRADETDAQSEAPVDQNPADVDQIVVKGPEYIEVQVTAQVIAIDPEEADQVKLDVLRRLDAFLHPMQGGPERQGWRPGRDVYISEIVAEIEQAPGVDHVAYAHLQGASMQQQCLCLGDGLRLDWDMPAGSQVSTFDEQVKLILANPLRQGQLPSTLVVYGLNVGNPVNIVTSDPSQPVQRRQIARLSPADPALTANCPLSRTHLTFDRPLLFADKERFDHWKNLAPALISNDQRIRLPVEEYDTAIDALGRVNLTGVTARGLRKGELLTMQHPERHRRRVDFLPVQAVIPCTALQRIFVPADHLVYSGEHEIEMTLEADHANSTAKSG